MGDTIFDSYLACMFNRIWLLNGKYPTTYVGGGQDPPLMFSLTQ